MESATSLTWTAILTLAFTTGVFTAGLEHLVGWLRDRSKERSVTTRDATYAAIRVAVVLEDFAIKCADAVSDVDLHRQSGGHGGQIHTKVSPLAEYPADIDWKSLDASLSAESLSLRNELSLGNGAIAAMVEFGDDDDVLVEAANQCGKCGYRAWQLAAALRRRYSLPNFDPYQVSWDVVGLLKKYHDQAIKKVEQNKGTSRAP